MIIAKKGLNEPLFSANVWHNVKARLSTHDLDTWSLDAWALGLWMLGLWTPGRLDSGRLNAWILDT